MTSNRLYAQLLNSLKTKKLVCFGVGTFFWQFISEYTGTPITMLIDNHKHGERLKIRGVEYKVMRIDDIKTYDPKQIVILITVKGDLQNDIKEQLHAIGYFNIFCWSEILQFEKPFYDNVDKHLLTYAAQQIDSNYKYKIAHLALHSVQNAGDIVLNYGIRQVLSKILGDIFFVMYSLRNTIETEKSVQRLNNFDAVIIGGGGLFLPDSNTNDISGWQWICSNELMSKVTKPMFGFAIGYNYFNGQEPTELFKKSLSHFAQQAKFVGLRNQRSINIVNTLICRGGV